MTSDQEHLLPFRPTDFPDRALGMLSKGMFSNVIECVRAAHYQRRLYPEEDLEPRGESDKGGDTKNNWAELVGPIPEDTSSPTFDRPTMTKLIP